MYNSILSQPEHTAAYAGAWETIKPSRLPHGLTVDIGAISAAASTPARGWKIGKAAERETVLTEVSVHSARVACYTWHLARAIEAGASRFEDRDASPELLALAALVHDIGKAAVSPSLLAKPGRLTPEEFERVQTHTLLGVRIIDRMALSIANPLRRIMGEACKCHHERWDGSGYPAGLSGNRIPYGARVVSVCDTYDAIVHNRVYAKARSHDTAMQIISDGRGILFDPDIVDMMLAVGPFFQGLQLAG